MKLLALLVIFSLIALSVQTPKFEGCSEAEKRTLHGCHFYKCLPGKNYRSISCRKPEKIHCLPGDVGQYVRGNPSAVFPGCCTRWICV